MRRRFFVAILGLSELAWWRGLSPSVDIDYDISSPHVLTLAFIPKTALTPSHS